MLHRLGLNWISPRPLHPKTDPESQEAFRKDFQSLGREVVGPDVKVQIEIWFQDEARMGQQGNLRIIWSPKGLRKLVRRDCGYKSCILYSAVCPKYHLEATHLCTKSNCTEMNQHLATIRDAVKKDHLGVVVLDRATLYRSKELDNPSNLSLLHLPPYSPELNPMENVYNYQKSTFHANRVFETLEEIRDNTQSAWKVFTENPELMTLIMHREWAVATTAQNI